MPQDTSGLRESYLYDRATIRDIQRAADEGIYRIRGFGAKRALPHFDDLVFLGASISRYPLEGYRESCGTDVTIGADRAERPLHLDIPITIAGMSFGSLSANAKEALGRGASAAGTSTTTGDGGMTAEERRHSAKLIYQYLPSRYGMNPDDLRQADAIEVVIGQGAKPGGGGMLLGQKIDARVAEMRTLPTDIDQRSACRHPDWTGPDDLEIKIRELREITGWQVPVTVKVGATRTYYDTLLAVKSGADAIVVDGMQGGTGATQDCFIEHVGIPTLPAVRLAADALRELGLHRGAVKLIVSGGIRGLRRPWLGPGVFRRMAGRPRPGRDHHAGPGPDRPPGSGVGRQAGRQLSAGTDPRGADPGPSLRQKPCAQLGAGGPQRLDRRGGGDGAGAVGRHHLDSRRRAVRRRVSRRRDHGQVPG